MTRGLPIHPYPSWCYFPRNSHPPDWSLDLLEVVAHTSGRISTLENPSQRLRSDDVLSALAPGLSELGYAVETSKAKAGKIRRPVLFGENGRAAVSYEVDAMHDEIGVVLEVEAGRGARGNAAYRDIVRTSLILDAKYLALLLPIKYRHLSGGREVVVQAYSDTRSQLDAIYASDRLRLPFSGVLLAGY